MSLTLYVGSKRFSSWSLRPYLALAHTGAQFDCKTILLDQDDTRRTSRRSTRPPKCRCSTTTTSSSGIPSRSASTSTSSYPEAKLWPTDRNAWAKRARLRRMHPGSPRCAVTCRWTSDRTSQGRAHSRSARRCPPHDGDLARGLDTSNGPFLFGTFSLADAMFAPVTTRFVTYGVDLDAPCRAYVDAVHALPGMKQW